MLSLERGGKAAANVDAARIAQRIAHSTFCPRSSIHSMIVFWRT